MQVGSIALIEVLVPLFVGIAFRTLLPQVAQRIREPIVRVAKSILSVACVAILVVTLPIVWGFIRLGTLTMYVAFTVLALGVGHVMGGPEELDRARVRVCEPPSRGRHQHRDGRLPGQELRGGRHPARGRAGDRVLALREVAAAPRCARRGAPCRRAFPLRPATEPRKAPARYTGSYLFTRSGTRGHGGASFQGRGDRGWHRHAG